MKHLKRFNEGFFSNFFKDDESEVTPETVKLNKKSSNDNTNSKLEMEAKERFPSLLKELDNKLRKSTESYIEVYQNPTFKTKSTKSVNHFLMNMIKSEYEKRGFRILKSHDGSDNSRYDWFKIIAD